MRVRFWQVSIACLLGVVIAAGGAQSPTGSTPAERPRVRPPSELTGWADWEGADDLLRRIKVPPAPALEPVDALKTFRLAPGYRIELVAAEPMVQSPIFFEFDPDGRIWVVEYQGYMRDLQGRGEGDPICRVVVLEDTNADGRADSSTVFLDGLVMPRSLSFVDGGVLVAEPPNLWLCRDTNGDLRCDEKVRVGTYGRAGNPQHAANGLRYGIDNWLHSADMPVRHRFASGRLTEQPTIHRGQFGVTFDDEGRFLTSRENRPLIADLIPAQYLLRNPNLLKAYGRGGPAQSRFGVNVDIAVDGRAVFPSRVTPAVTLGALELRPDGRLRTYTVVSGNSFYNGHQFPADAYGNVFVPDAGGHLVGRLKLTGDVDLEATRFYADEQELLTSSDERFRPVNSRVGPDGALYIADMYHGIIEHVIFMVPYLEKQIRERRLEEAPDKGRIYRIVYEGNPLDRRPPRLSSAGVAGLVSALGDANGWRRLTAQRLLVERRGVDAVGPLEDLARSGQPLGRLHALWTLDGLEALRWSVLLRALSDADDRVRAAAVRLAEKMAGSDEADRVFDRLVALAGDPSPRVRLQLTLTAGAFKSGVALDLIAKLSNDNPHHLFRAAALTGLGGRELEFLTLWSAHLPDVPADHQLETVRSLAEAIMHESRPSRVERTLAFLDTQRSTAASNALLSGMADALTRGPKPEGATVELGREPDALTRLARSDDPAVRQSAFRVLGALSWPGAVSVAATVRDVPSLSAEETRLAVTGRDTYGRTCATCHQLDGAGLPNVAPRLAGSDWVAGSPQRLIRVVLHGMYGPIKVNGDTWNLHMPGFGVTLDDERIAGVLTYIRRAWGNGAGSVRASEVSEQRKMTATRVIAWTEAELMAATPGGGERSASRRPILPDGQGTFSLPARLAVTFGRELAYRPSLDILAPWRHEHDVAEWLLEVPAGGAYDVSVTLAADEASAGDRFVIASEHSQIVATVLSSGGYDRFLEYACGRIELAAGQNRIVMRPAGPLKRELADVRGLRLVRSPSLDGVRE